MTLAQRAAAFFLKLTNGLSTRQFQDLLSCGKVSPEVYLYDAVSHEAHAAAPGDVAWPLEFLLAKHNRKFIMPPKSPARPADFAKAWSAWENMIRWRHIFSDSAQDAPENPWRHLRSKHPVQLAPLDALPDDVISYLATIRDDMATTIIGASSKSRTTFTRVRRPKIFDLALDLLSVSKFDAVPTDKDGGMTLVLKKELIEDKRSILRSSQYAKVFWFEASENDPGSILDVIEDFKGSIRSAVSTLDPAGSDGEARTPSVLFKELLRDVRFAKPHHFLSKLECTVKTHKGAGAVVLRPIHACPAHPFRPVMRLVASMLQERLRKLPHLLRDTDDLLCKLRRHKIPHHHRIIKIDIKDYFMSGEHDNLISNSSELIDPERRSCFKDLLRPILAHQYVRLDGDTDCAYRVVTGSGMGMLCSGEVSDAAFYSMAERRTVLLPHFRRRFQISFYGRFKDDIILVCGARKEELRNLLEEMRASAGEFRLQVESVSAHSAVMLDIELFKGPPFERTGVLSYRHYRKPTSIWRPLDCESYHCPSVHVSWPLAYVRRLRSRSSNPCEASRTINEFFKLYAAVQRRKLEPPKDHESSKDPSNSAKHRDSWLVLPFRSEWYYAHLQKALSHVVPSSLSHTRVRVTWKNSGKHLIHELRTRKRSTVKGEKALEDVEVVKGWM